MPDGILSQSLDQCFLGTEARAAVLVARGGRLAAFSSGLMEHADAAAGVLSRCCENGERLMGFLELGEGNEALLCAAPAAEGMTVGLLFDPETRISAARAQLDWMLNCLSEAGDLATEEPALSEGIFPEEPPIPSEALTPLFGDVPPPDPNPPAAKSAPKVAPSPPMPKHCSCVLASFPPHRLEGKAAEQVRQALAALAQERGWELNEVRVAPEYLQFSLVAPPETTIGEILRSVRERTAAALGVEGALWRPSYLLGAVERIAPEDIG